MIYSQQKDQYSVLVFFGRSKKRVAFSTWPAKLKKLLGGVQTGRFLFEIWSLHGS